MESFVGIDISRDVLDVAVFNGPVWQVQNDEEGLAALTARLQALPVRLVVLEATGGIEVPVAVALAAARVPAAVVNPRPVHRPAGQDGPPGRPGHRPFRRSGEA